MVYIIVTDIMHVHIESFVLTRVECQVQIAKPIYDTYFIMTDTFMLGAIW
jgi:hypothetical protein